VSAPKELGAPLRALERLCAELGYESGEEEVGASDSSALVGGRSSILGSLSAEDEALVEAIRQGLARLAAAIGGEGRGEERASGVRVVLDGTELMVRSELIRGQAKQLRGLLPGFVFLVALSIVEQDEALELSRRTSELIEGALDG
jgi:hypothetical protein